ncbi:hypothetical protein [Paludisphaera rhizosphaerae]|uniref:hypothetical protein n=1 Tax=Paludisphaera rhizosphaerae TaxID=2711216 RepID=UPI0013E9E459|nr:hypothetical protein [Paludisphaera rhizosphaerae]
MARAKHWNPSLADLAVLIVGFAVSAAVLRFTMASSLSSTGIRLTKSLQNAATASLSLCPLSWTVAVLAMRRTSRRCWPLHPAVVVGLTSFAIAVYEFVPRVMPALLRLTRSWSLDSATLFFGAMLLGHVGKALFAWAFIILVAKRIRRPDSWLAVAGWLLWLCWVGGDFSRYVVGWLA